MSYEISDATSDELNFCFHSAKWSLRHSEEWRETSTAAAFAVLNPQINEMIDRSAVLVARVGRKILGWIAWEAVGDETRIGYVYVRHEFRRRGVADQLLAAVIDENPNIERITYSTPTSRFTAVASRYGLTFQETP